MEIIDQTIIVLYLIATLAIGIISGRNIATFREYAVGKKDFSTTLLVVTIVATWASGSGAVSYVSNTFRYGIINIFADFGIPITMLIMAYVVAPRMTKFLNNISAADIIGDTCGKYSRIVAGVCSILFSVGVVTGQIKVVGMLLNYFLNVNIIYAIIFSSAIMVFYSSIGGIRAVTATDMFQFFTVIVTIPMVCNIGMAELDGWDNLIANLPKEHLSIFGHTPQLKYKLLTLFFLLAIPALNPAAMQRMLMAKDVNQVQETFKWSAVIFIFYIVLASFIGLVAKAFVPDLNPNEALLYIIKVYVPVGVKGIALCGILALVMSTADSFINTASVNFVNDIMKPIFGKIEDKRELFLSKILTLLMGIFATIIAISFEGIVEIVHYMQNFYFPVVTIPLFAILFGYKPSGRAFLSSGVAGIGTFAVWQVLKIEQETGFGSLLPSLAANLATLLIVSFFDSKVFNSRVRI